jgi:hypothetical protein
MSHTATQACDRDLRSRWSTDDPPWDAPDLCGRGLRCAARRTNSAGLAIFRYRTRCGTVYGHTGNTAGYTQFMASPLNGQRSVTASVSGQIPNKMSGPRLAAFKRLRQIEADAVCTALSGNGVTGR